jgi:ATP phosphoribosyltransferase regulatory subunit
MMAALDNLAQVARLLDAYGVSAAVTYDLAEVRDLDYYTGVTFEGFAPGIGFNLISGGRYDELIGHFGPGFPAVGWALTLDRVLLARELQGRHDENLAVDVLLSAGSCAECLGGRAGARGGHPGGRLTLAGRSRRAVAAARSERGGTARCAAPATAS